MARSNNIRSVSLESILGVEDLDFDQLFTVHNPLGSGNYGAVFVVKHKITNDEFAAKVIDRSKLKPKDDKAVYDEVRVLKSLRQHENIVSLINFFETPTEFHIVLEYARGGDVFERLAKRRFYSERDARLLAKEFLLALQYIHSMGYVHRDLKAENLLLSDQRDDSSGLKVADFGFAKRMSDAPTNKGLLTRCGTPTYVAPEICMGSPYGKGVDVWSAGVLLYLLLGGYLPFQSSDHKELFRKIKAADYVYLEKYWDPISRECKQLISKMLTVDPKARITIDEALESQWFRMGETKDEHLTGTHGNLKKFNAKRKLRSVIISARYATKAIFWDSTAISFMPNETETAKHSSLNNVSSSTVSTKSTRGSVGSRGSTGTALTFLSKGKVGMSFSSLYTKQECIRKSDDATIWTYTRKKDKARVAVKIMKRSGWGKSQTGIDQNVLNEVAILQSLTHKHVINLFDFVEEKKMFYLIMEYMGGGDLFDKIIERSQYTEKDAKDLAHALLLAVQYIHERGVAHRDLKPQNLLLLKDDDTYIKVADFGFAKRVHSPLSLITRLGTPTYVAPEILKNHPHDERVDNWSIGVIIYVILVGYPPFTDQNQSELFRKIKYADIQYFEEDWKDISPEAKDFIQSLLVVDPIHRCTARQALCHDWLTNIDDERLSRSDLAKSLHLLKNSNDSFNRDSSMKAMNPLPR